MTISQVPRSSSARVRTLPTVTKAYVATVTMPGKAKAKVRIDGVTDGYEVACQVVDGLFTSNNKTKPASSGDHAAHVHRLGADLAAGDKVLVVPLGGQRELWVIVARMGVDD
jgi:hypothetical protein